MAASMLGFVAQPAPAGKSVLARERKLSGGQRDLARDRPQPAQRAGVAAVGGSVLEAELQRLLGTAWDNELEPFRRASDGAPVRWLNATG